MFENPPYYCFITFPMFVYVLGTLEFSYSIYCQIQSDRYFRIKPNSGVSHKNIDFHVRNHVVRVAIKQINAYSGLICDFLP